MPPTIVLVHGESASWDRVIHSLHSTGHDVEPSGECRLWKRVPSWFLIGEENRVIPAQLQRFMAKRAGARRTIEIPGASHAIAVSHPEATAHLSLEAAAVRVAA